MNTYQRKFLPLVVYQIYPRSFCDYNNDGIGDFKGIESKIDYLCDLGVNAIWISPCFKSPKIDNGYDVSDYRAMDEEYGTLEDFKRLISKLHERGIKVILDLVANHTSDKHKWFVQSRKSKDNPYRQYYYWAKEPLNDWQACFGGSAWEFDQTTGEYYLHSYAKAQPDLNWTNSKVRQEIKDIVYYWVNLGVDGFRCDVLDQIAKDFSRFDGNGCGEKLGEYITELFGDDKLKDIFTVGECWGFTQEEYSKKCGEEARGLKSSFSFGHLLVDRKSRFEKKPFIFKDFTSYVYKWANMAKDDLLYPLVLENHDQPRIISKFCDPNELRYESATMMATFIYLQKGVPFIYQGQEIGMINPFYDDISDFDDIESVNYYYAHLDQDKKELIKKINFGSRDNGRRLMPWSEKTPKYYWLKPFTLQKEINVKKDIASSKSVYKFYQKLLNLRKQELAFIYGDTKTLFNLDNGCTGYEREYNGEKFVVLCNHKEKCELNLEYIVGGKVVLSNYGVDTVNGNITLKPFETIVVKLK